MGDRSSHNRDEADRRRRAALKVLAGVGGSVTASQWVKPVMDAVVLPAHAASSGINLPASYAGPGQIHP